MVIFHSYVSLPEGKSWPIPIHRPVPRPGGWSLPPYESRMPWRPCVRRRRTGQRNQDRNILKDVIDISETHQTKTTHNIFFNFGCTWHIIASNIYQHLFSMRFGTRSSARCMQRSRRAVRRERGPFPLPHLIARGNVCSHVVYVYIIIYKYIILYNIYIYIRVYIDG